jgi:hypothetical protein
MKKFFIIILILFFYCSCHKATEILDEAQVEFLKSENLRDSAVIMLQEIQSQNDSLLTEYFGD